MAIQAASAPAATASGYRPADAVQAAISANATVIAVLLISALSVSGAIFLILEMNHPLDGRIKVSSAPLHKALEHLGR